jgi:cyanophycinase-like exopeptidase
MYDRQVDEKGIFKPGACAKNDATKMTEQSRCRHPFDQLKWGANGKSVYASCGACGLKTCVMYSRADAFVAEAEEDVKDVHVVHLTPGLVMMDTGCRAAVGGTSWHRDGPEVLQRGAAGVLPVRTRGPYPEYTVLAL